MRPIKAAIFDMDGLLLDTEIFAQLIWITLIRSLGISAEPKIMREFIGRNMEECAMLASRHFGPTFPYHELKKLRNEILPSFLLEFGSRVKPGAKEILSFLHSQQIKLGLYTSSDRELAEALLKQADMYKYFEVFVCGNEVKNGKPHPEGYLLSCEKLGVAPDEAYGYEDSHAGIFALHVAGLRAVMVPDIVPVTPDIRRLCHLVAHDLHEALVALRMELASQ